MYNKLTLIVFAGLLFGISIANLLLPDKNFSENENRYLAQFPHFTISGLFEGSYTQDIENYINDQFVVRDTWIGVKTTAEKALGKSEINGIYIGSDGFLFAKHTDAEIASSPFQKNVEALSQFVTDTTATLGNGHMSVMIVPTSDGLLPDKLPANAPIYHQMDLLNQLQKALGNKVFIDLITPFATTTPERYYYKTDHHWTSFGAFVAYQTYCSRNQLPPLATTDFDIQTVSTDFHGTHFSKLNDPTVAYDSLELFKPKQPVSYEVTYDGGKVVTDTLYALKHLSTRDQYAVFLDGNHPLVTIHNTELSNGKHLLLLKDSYAHAIVPFLSLNYETIDMIDLRYFKENLPTYMTEHQITDLLVLYNTINFANDTKISRMFQ